jgi:hypothetical protein
MEARDSVHIGTSFSIVIIRFASNKSGDLSTPAESIEVQGFHATIPKLLGQSEKTWDNFVERCFISEEIVQLFLKKEDR